MSEFIDKILKENELFVENKEYKKFSSTKYPQKKAVIISCMDTRLTELLPAALNLKNGDVKLIKNAGGVVSHPFGSVMRSLMVAIYTLGVDKILIIGHHDCGMQKLGADSMLELMKEKGITQEKIDVINSCGVDLQHWLTGFSSVEQSVESTATTIRNHPLIPACVEIHGLVIDPETGKLTYVLEK